MTPLSPVLRGLPAYPFVRIDAAKRRVAERGVELIDLSIGDPREPTPRFVLEAVAAAALEERAGYPLAPGLPALREAVAAWVRRRFDAELDPEREVIPTYGSKEAIFQLAQVVAGGDKPLVLTTEPGYPVPERGALFAGAEPVALPLREANGFLPDLDAVPEETWRRAAIVWVNYPNNPTGATAPLAFYEPLAELARRHDVVLASDEAYSELWFEEPPASALQLADRTNVLVFNTLSKRSSMTGLRSGFAAGDPELIAALRAFRPNAGTAPQVFLQRASIAAWEDEAHVEATRARYAAKRRVLLDALGRAGVRVADGSASMFLWAEVPGGEGSEAFAARLLEHGVVVAPGVYFGPSGEGYVRLALVPELRDCERAAAILEEVL